MGRAAARIGIGIRAFASNLHQPGLRRAQLSFGAVWASEWAATVVISVVAFRDGGVAAVGLVGLARMVPAALLAPFAATLADRYRRDKVLVAVGTVRGAGLGAGAILLASGAATTTVYALVAVATVAQTLFRPAHSALLPTLCRTPDELTSANVVRGLLDSLATLIGPLAAALLIAFGGTDVALAACAAASLASAVLIARVRYEVPRRGHAAPIRVHDALEGLRLIARDPALRTLTALTTAQTFLRGCVTVLGVVVAIDLLGGGDADVGLLNAAIGLGAVFGSVIASTMSWHGRLGRCLGAGVALWGLPLALLAGVPQAAAAALLFGVVGLGNALVDIGVFTLLARLSPDRVMARVFAAFEGVLTLGVAAGAAATPLVIHVLDIRGALIALGSVGPLAALAAWPALRGLDRRIAARDDDIDVLQHVPMLQPLPQAMIEHLASAIEREAYAPGAPVFREGDAGSRFYVITDGRAEVSRNGVTLSRLGHGDGFGEIALLRSGVARTATVRAAGETPLCLLALEESRFIAAVTGYASASAIADALVTDRLASHRPLGEDRSQGAGPIA